MSKGWELESGCLSSLPPGVRMGTARTFILLHLFPSYSMFLFLHFLSSNRTGRQS